MNTITIKNKTYKIPAVVLENNANASSFYVKLSIVEVLTGREDFDRIESEGGDWFDSDCFGVYGEHYGVNGDDAPINLVGEAMYAWFSDYKGEENELYLLEEVVL